MHDVASPAPAHRSRRRRRSSSRPSDTAPRIVTALCGAVALALALGLASQHPIGGGLPALALVLVMTLLARYFWMLWPGWMLALVPLLGFAPWTGWTVVDELDLLVLASAAGGYLAISGPHRLKPPEPAPIWRRELRWRMTLLLLMGLGCAVGLFAMLHGMLDAGGWRTGWTQNHTEPGAALRAGKPVLLLLLMLPLWQRVARRSPQTLTPALAAGAAGALWVVCAGALYERLAYSGLTDFSADYRTVSLFWEMNMGGAALDGVLALLLPFALLAVLRRRQGLGFGLALALLMLGFYVVLTTFSRGLYLALALSLPVCALLWAAQEGRRRRGDRDPVTSWLPGQVLPGEPARPPLPWAVFGVLLLLVLGSGLVAWWIFPTSGYRGALAVCGTVAALLAQPPAVAQAARLRLLSAALGLLLAVPLLGLVVLLAAHVSKAAYVCFALAWSLSLFLAWRTAQQRLPWASALGDALRAGCWFTTLGCVAVVAGSWGGADAALIAVPPLLLLALAWPLTQGGTLGTVLQGLSWRSRLGALGALMLVLGVIAALGGGAYLSSRVETTQNDLQTRLHHWGRTLSIVEAEDGWIVGSGAGRYPALFAANAPSNEQLGNFLARNAVTPTYVQAIGARHELGDGSLLRLSQRIDAAPPGLVLRLAVRNEDAAQLQVEVCEKHLIYGGACLAQPLSLPASAAGFTRHELRLGGVGELGGRGWLRPGLVFSVMLSSKGTTAQLRELSLKGDDGRELLRNGSFEQGLERWYLTSDRHHLPWHAKSLPLHLLFEQGLIGLLLMTALFGIALGRLLIGTGRDHALAPALCAGLLGFAIVGVFDSLIDAPRIAFLFFTLLAIALGLRAPPPGPPPAPKSRSRLA